MYRHLFGIESYLLIQLVALICSLAGCCLIRRSNIRLRHAAVLTVLYVLCNFLAASLIRFCDGPNGRHTLFDHPALAHFFEGGYWGWPIAFFPCVTCLSLRVSSSSSEFLPSNCLSASTCLLRPEGWMFPGWLLLRLRDIRAVGGRLS